jgi:RNA-directed DNA polymerase
MTKPFNISKTLVWEAYQKVKANGGAAGVDNESIQAFSEDLKGNLYKLWNRLSSGSYFPPPVKGVSIPKKSGGERMLGVPTVADRIAQMVAKMMLEPFLEPVFHHDSYGYRPGRSAHDAIAVVRQRCWRYDWVVEFDIRRFFDSIDHELLGRALRKHCQIPWVLLYVERWLKAPMVTPEGELTERTAGTPQGGVISPLLANLFLHYAFDRWVCENLRGIPFCRYADDGVLHCKSKEQAEMVVEQIRARFYQCGLELHPEKTRIIYCRDVNRKGNYPVQSFTFLGYTFRPRKSMDKYGRVYVNFSPAVSRDALKEMRQTIRRWHIQLKNDKELVDLSAMFNPILRGWMNYYGRFYASAMSPVWKHMNGFLVRWLMRKYKGLAWHKRRAKRTLGRLAEAWPSSFVHWKAGYAPMAG